MRLIIVNFLYLIVLLFIQSAHADNFTTRFERYSIEQGLSQNTVSAIVKDSQGFIWFGTRDGLNRFDGYQFKVFRHDEEVPGAISDNYIWSLFEDSDGILWIGTANGGLNRYDRQSERFTHFTRDDNNPDSLSDKEIRCIFQDSEGTLWVGTNNGGLNRFDRKTGKFSHWSQMPGDKDSMSHDRVYAIAEAKPGELWLGTANGVIRYDTKANTFVRYRHDAADPNSLSHNRIRAIFKDARGRLWFGSDGGGLNRFDFDSGGFEHFVHDEHRRDSLPSNYVLSIAAENADELWLGTWGGGLSRFDIVTGKFSSMQNDPSNSNSLSGNLVYSLYKDNKDVLWIGTSGGGINKFDTRTTRFGHVRHQESDPGSLSENNVRAMLIDSKGTLWVGTRGGGLHRKDAGSDAYVRYVHSDEDPYSLANDQIYAIYEDSKGEIWVGTAKGLERFNRETGHFSLYAHHSGQNSLSDNRVKQILEDEPGVLWIATHGGGVNRFNVASGHFEVFRHDDSDPDSLSHDIVTNMLLDDKRNLWVATLGGGLNRFDRYSGKFEHFRHEPDNNHSLSYDRVFTLHQSKDGDIWVGTARGLNRYSPQTGRFKRYFEKDGLPNDVVLAIVEDRNGDLWLSGNNGLSRFSSSDGKFKTFDVKDGLQSNEFNLNAACKSADGELLFGGINGFNRFYPKAISEDIQKPPVHLTGFLLSNKSVGIGSAHAGGFTLPKAIDSLKQLKLTYRQTLVTFEFAALDYSNPQKNHYAYKLEGWDDDWIYTDASKRYATYTRLDAGNYVFRVKASNKDGYWNEQGKSLPVVVLPPWYQTWQAYLIYLLALGGSVYGVYRYRTRSLIRRAHELEHKVRQRTETINQLMQQKQRMFANVSHEFKTPLTLILNPLDNIVKDPQSRPFADKLAMMRRNGQRLLHMVEQLLELSKLESAPGAQQYHYYSLSETLNRLLTSFQPLFDSKNLELQRTPYQDVVLYLTADSLEMILSNLLSNALKYTPEGGRIVVMVKSDGKKVVIAVCDSGIGISEKDQQIVFNRFTRASEVHDEAIPGAGIGLALVKELVEVNKGTIGLVSEPGKGSIFTVTLPVSTEQQVELTASSGSAAAAVPELEELNVAKLDTQPAVAAESGAAATILVIDDNPDMLSLITDTLGGRYHCIAAKSGEEGLTAAKDNLPDLVISDVMMPGLSGFDVLKALKESDLTNHIPVILLTAKGDVESRIKGWSEKADEYLEKPFNGEELLVRIDNILTIRALLRRRYQSVIRPDDDDYKTSAKAKVSEPVEPGSDDQLINVNQVFFDKVYGVLERHYADEGLDVSFLASKLAMSQRQLGRKMKAVLDYTPTELIRIFRLKKAAELLKLGEPPGAVAHKVGFSSHSYFSQCFKAQYDCLPSSYR